MSNRVDIHPSSWALVDGLGRRAGMQPEVGPLRKGKFVGCFYWTWHNLFAYESPRNITKIMERHPEARNDFNHPAWEGTPNWTPFHWDEPLLGYYNSSDDFVMRKHAELLGDAGVDVIIFDCSNGALVFQNEYENVFRVFSKAKEDGVCVPQIMFLLNFFDMDQAREQLLNIYENLYKTGRYKDLWFLWDGKPLVMVSPSALRAEDRMLLDFFTFRVNVPTYFDADYAFDQKSWGWCSVYPQTRFGVREDGSVEQMCVSCAQNANEYGLCAMNDYRGGVFGRGYAKGNDASPEDPAAYLHGLNFQQQWDYAIANDPDFIFLTGWNEYVVQRLTEWYATPNGCSDNFNAAYSRDIEPSAGILKDHFYCQLVENIRRYKGADAPSVNGEYFHYTGSTQARNCDGYKGVHFTENTMRNDIVWTKVECGDTYVHFTVEALNDLSPCTDAAWMRLLIDTGDVPNWEGFSLIVNRVAPDNGACVVERSLGGWIFERVGLAPMEVTGKILRISIPRSVLGTTTFNFKWADNTRAPGAIDDSGDILDFYRYGDVAPGGRFCFAFGQ